MVSGGGGSLLTFLNNIANMMTGQLGQVLAVIAIALAGLNIAFGGNHRNSYGVLIGIAIVFSAAWVVQMINGTGGSGAF